ncbi:unnamed protein product [Mytilus coruscus]|uniref:Uncharacterized protein n=1 Tax=Mytilus coruscus TaxID=42192 RepID=A0A6J8AEF9_MYTCO|nr:unnamed protein product [Mytilus coruscus]
MNDNEAWVPRCLQDPEVDDQKNWMKGWVESEEDLQTVLEAHRRASLSTFVTWSDDSKKKNKTERRILWKYGDVDINQGSMPFCVNRTIMYTCQYGKPRRKNSNENMVQSPQSPYQRSYTIKEKNLSLMQTVQCMRIADIHRILQYHTACTVICNSSQAVSSTKAAFSSFSLPIEKHQNIAEAIGGYFKSEQVERKCDLFGSSRRKVMKKIDIHLDIYLMKYVEENKSRQPIPRGTSAHQFPNGTQPESSATQYQTTVTSYPSTKTPLRWSPVIRPEKYYPETPTQSRWSSSKLPWYINCGERHGERHSSSTQNQ